MNLEGQIALVNGAASGIGEAAANSLARHGCTVVLTDIQEEPVNKVTECLKGAGFRALKFKLDVTKSDEIDFVVSQVIKEFGRIDILVQCSGIYTYSPFLEMSEKMFDDTIRVNLKGTYFCCQRVAREMVRKEYGRIICLASTAGQRGGTMGRSHYGASKGGVIAICKSMANELGPFGITVNAIAPGLIYTNSESVEAVPIWAFWNKRWVGEHERYQRSYPGRNSIVSAIRATGETNQLPMDAGALCDAHAIHELS